MEFPVNKLRIENCDLFKLVEARAKQVFQAGLMEQPEK